METFAEISAFLQFIRGDRAGLGRATLQFWIAEMTDVLNQELPVTEDGHISAWISGFSARTRRPIDFKAEIEKYELMLNRLSDINVVRSVVAELSSDGTPVRVSDVTRRLAENAGLSLLTGIPPSVKQIRALQAMARSFQLFNESPLKLMKRAESGDRSAVLALVRIDKLFLHDPSTKDVIVNAERTQDLNFLKQLARAISYRLYFSPGMTCRCLLFVFFALETQLPPHSQLQQWLDPHGSMFRGIFAFDKFFERCRQEFESLNEGFIR